VRADALYSSAMKSEPSLKANPDMPFAPEIRDEDIPGAQVISLAF
jgi:hypothetical protein